MKIIIFVLYNLCDLYCALILNKITKNDQYNTDESN